MTLLDLGEDQVKVVGEYLTGRRKGWLQWKVFRNLMAQGNAGTFMFVGGQPLRIPILFSKVVQGGVRNGVACGMEDLRNFLKRLQDLDAPPQPCRMLYGRRGWVVAGWRGPCSAPPYCIVVASP